MSECVYIRKGCKSTQELQDRLRIVLNCQDPKISFEMRHANLVAPKSMASFGKW